MSQPRNPTESEFKEWLANPVTIRLNEWLRKEREDLKELWAKGVFTAQDQFATAISNAEAIGQCYAYTQVVDLEYGQLIGESDVGQSERPEATGPGSVG